MFDEILVAFDGSEASHAASSKAVELAEEVDAELHYIEVIDITEFPGHVDWEEVIDRIKLERSEELDEAIQESMDRGVYAGSKVTRGIPEETIIERAEEIDADLIVMGASGRSGVTKILGSTTERVLEKSGMPVMSVKG